MKREMTEEEAKKLRLLEYCDRKRTKNYVENEPTEEFWKMLEADKDGKLEKHLKSIRPGFWELIAKSKKRREIGR